MYFSFAANTEFLKIAAFGEHRCQGLKQGALESEQSSSSGPISLVNSYITGGSVITKLFGGLLSPREFDGHVQSSLVCRRGVISRAAYTCLSLYLAFSFS